jgi:hypothetical protein
LAQTAVAKAGPVAEYGAVTGRHRNTSGLRRALGILLTFVAVLAVGAAGWGGYRYLNRPACTGSPVTLNVAASPDISPAIQATGNAWAKSRTSGHCIEVKVTAADSADVSALLAGAAGTQLAGVGQPNGKAQIPDVWVPDSSLWLARLAAATKKTGVPPTSIASSPVVFATPEPIAKQLGWPDKPVTWQNVLSQITGSGQVKTGIVSPARDAAGLSGLLTLAGVAQSGSNADSVTVAALRSLAQNQSTIRADLVGKFPKSTDAASMASGLGAAPLTEQAVLAYNASQPPVPLAAIYLQPAATPMDYPYVAIPNPLTSPEKTQLVTDLLTQLKAPAFKNELASQNLRAPDGTFGTGVSAGPGAPATVTKPATTTDAAAAAAAIDKVINTWQAVTQSGRMLAVIDVSGSMLEKVPTAGGKTREEVTVDAAGRGLALFDDSWSLGVWIFSTNMVGTQDYKELVPIGPLAVQRPAVIGQLGNVKPKSNGDTGLYDTTIAAYKAVQAGWDPGKVNSVLIFTDGQNDDRNGISLDQLKQQLQQASDPNKPIQLIVLGIGDGVSKAELDQVVAPVGGAAFVVADPTKIGDVFLQAIALRHKD